jgi:hypothetical protein
MELRGHDRHSAHVSSHRANLDRTGVIASIFCAIHCAVAPLLILIAPTLGGIWVHPLSHFTIAGLVLPIAALALRNGVRAHGKRWVLSVGTVGICLVLVGAALPYLTGSASDCGPNCDQCCPSFVIDEVTGEESLNIPPASIITLMGGVSLIVAHMANLRCCSRCSVTNAA